MNEEVGDGACFFNFYFLVSLKSQLDSLGDVREVGSKGVGQPALHPKPGSPCHQNDVPQGSPYSTPRAGSCSKPCVGSQWFCIARG